MTLWRRAGGLRGLGIALVVLAMLRLVQLLAVAWLDRDIEALTSRLLIWDGGWFINVATEGYPDGYAYDSDGVLVGNGFAFFPVFPLLIRGVTLLGVPAPEASLLVAGVAGAVAGVLIYYLGTAIYSRTMGYLLMVLVCAQPMAVVLVMGYTEPVFLAFVAGAMLAAYRRIWWAAGLAGVAAALTRPTGVAVGLALAVAAVLLWRTARRQATAGALLFIPPRVKEKEAAGRALPSPTRLTPAGANGGGAGGAGEGGGDLLRLAAERTGGGAGASRVIGKSPVDFADKGPIKRSELIQAFAAAALTLLAGPAFVLWVGWQVGEWDAWFKVQSAGWGSTFDGGTSVVSFILETLGSGGGMVELVTVWFILGVVALCFLAIFDRVWLPLLTYGYIGLVLVVGQAGYWHSKPRLLVPVLLLAAVPIAAALAKVPRRTAIAVLALWSAFGLWFGAYMITVWPFTI